MSHDWWDGFGTAVLIVVIVLVCWDIGWRGRR